MGPGSRHPHLDPRAPVDLGHAPAEQAATGEIYNDVKVFTDGASGERYAFMASNRRGVVVYDVSDPAALVELFAGVDAVISCLPYYLNAVAATAAHSAGVHYLDLTEDVATSRTVKQLA